MDGKQIIVALKKKFECTTDVALANKIGGTSATIGNLSKRKNLGETDIINIIQRSIKKTIEHAYLDPFRIIVEFYPISKTKSSQDKKWEILNIKQNNNRELRHILSSRIGIYSYYNSQGEIIYVGKTEKDLWAEMKQAFNRKMTSLNMYRVEHPKGFVNIEAEEIKKIIKRNVKMHESAQYFSAYSVPKPLISGLEAQLIRMIPNNLVNARIEGQTKRK